MTTLATIFEDLYQTEASTGIAHLDNLSTLYTVSIESALGEIDRTLQVLESVESLNTALEVGTLSNEGYEIAVSQVFQMTGLSQAVADKVASMEADDGKKDDVKESRLRKAWEWIVAKLKQLWEWMTGKNKNTGEKIAEIQKEVAVIEKAEAEVKAAGKDVSKKEPVTYKASKNLRTGAADLKSDFGNMIPLFREMTKIDDIDFDNIAAKADEIVSKIDMTKYEMVDQQMSAKVDGQTILTSNSAKSLEQVTKELGQGVQGAAKALMDQIQKTIQRQNKKLGGQIDEATMASRSKALKSISNITAMYTKAVDLLVNSHRNELAAAKKFLGV